eukprot:8964049-Ditylum_brightwellii.AAC.1
MVISSMGTLSAQQCLSVLRFIHTNLALPLKYLFPSQRVEMPGMMMTTSARMKRKNRLMMMMMKQMLTQMQMNFLLLVMIFHNI